MTIDSETDRPVAPRRSDRSMVVKVYQLIDGDYRCYCGEPAVLWVTSQPDSEPGVTCYKHAMEWIDTAVRLLGRLYDR